MLFLFRKCATTPSFWIQSEVGFLKPKNLSSAVFLRWSFMPDSFCNMPVHLDDPFPHLMEFWSLNLAEDNVCQLASCSELVLYRKTGSVITSTVI